MNGERLGCLNELAGEEDLIPPLFADDRWPPDDGPADDLTREQIQDDGRVEPVVAVRLQVRSVTIVAGECGVPREIHTHRFPSRSKNQPANNGTTAVETHMAWHPLNLLRIIFAVLVVGMIIVGLTTRARPQTPRQWTIVWVVVAFLAWALLGFGWLRA